MIGTELISHHCFIPDRKLLCGRSQGQNFPNLRLTLLMGSPSDFLDALESGTTRTGNLPLTSPNSRCQFLGFVNVHHPTVLPIVLGIWPVHMSFGLFSLFHGDKTRRAIRIETLPPNSPSSGPLKVPLASHSLFRSCLGHSPTSLIKN